MVLTDPLNWTAAVLMILNGLFGILCNSLIIYIFFKTPSERNSFNLICVYRAIGNCIILIWAFLGTFVPVALFGSTIFSPLYQTIVITCVNGIYAGLQYCGFVIAVNRFFVMFFPQLYSTVFSVKLTFVIITNIGKEEFDDFQAVMNLIVVIRIINAAFDFSVKIPNNCFSIYSSTNLTWSSDLDPRCSSVPFSVVDVTAVVVGILIIMNLATFFKIYLFYKSKKLGDKVVEGRMKKNKIMFIQTILQDVIYLVDMIFTFSLSDFIPGRFWTFFCGSFVWESVHSIDGLIMIMFNERIKFLKRKMMELMRKKDQKPNDRRVELAMTATVMPTRTLQMFDK